MLVKSLEYRSGDEPLLLDLWDKALGETIFKYCVFTNISIDDGKSVDATFLSCKIDKLNCYWGLFNGCLFVDTRFECCEFSGCSFAACRFLNCEFINCRFEKSNLDSPCNFDKTQWFGCKVAGCTGLPELAFSAM